MTVNYLVIGNSSAGMAAAQAIRARDDKGKIIVVGEEDHFCYYRPNLDSVVAGQRSAEEIYLYDQKLYDQNNIQLKRGKRVYQVLPKDKKVLVEGEGELTYDRLLVASGAWPRQAPWQKVPYSGVANLRNIRDAQHIISLISDTERAVVVGGGLLGIDMAQALNERRIPVTHLVREKFLGSVILDSQGGRIIAAKSRAAGVELAVEEEVLEVVAKDGRVAGVKTSKGRILDCQLVIACIGVLPRVDFLAGSDIVIDRGVIVNRYLESSIPDIYAAGDVAQVPDWISGENINQTSWFNSTWQGTAAGANMVSRESTVYKDISYNYIDIYALNQTSFGSIHPKLADEILTGDYPQGDNYKKLFVRGDKLIGGMFLTEGVEDLWGFVDVVKAQLGIGPFKSELLKKEFNIKAVGKRAKND